MSTKWEAKDGKCHGVRDVNWVDALTDVNGIIMNIWWTKWSTVLNNGAERWEGAVENSIKVHQAV